MEQEGRSYSGERFRALALHLASRSLDDPAFDKDRLANLLYHCDFIAYARLGRLDHRGNPTRSLRYPRSVSPEWPSA